MISRDGEKNSRCLLEIKLTGLAYGLMWKIRKREIKNGFLISGFGNFGLWCHILRWGSLKSRIWFLFIDKGFL